MSRLDNIRAREVSTMEFVNEETFESVGNGIDPRNPFEPWMHEWPRNDETSIDDDGESQDTCNCKSL